MRIILISLIGALMLTVAFVFFIDPDERMPLQISESASTAPTTTETTVPAVPAGGGECNADAKICPDGSAVGRSGPACEFAECPSVEASSDTVTTYLGGTVTRFNVELRPEKLISDSRCPMGVACIWAGTVEVRTHIETGEGTEERIFKLGEPVAVDGFTITLTEVTPLKKVDVEIPESAYRFTFEIKK